jgi:hypothetical protein
MKMTKFTAKKPTISRAMNILLIKLAQHLELNNIKEACFYFRSDCDDPFVLEDVYFDDQAFKGDAPFRSGNDFQSFFEQIEAEFKNSTLDGNEEDDTQTFSLNLKAIPSECGKTKWVTSFNYCDTANNCDEQEHVSKPDYFKDDPVHCEIVKFMKDNNAKNMVYYFSGGGDSGDLNDLEISVDSEIVEAQSILIEETGERVSFETIAYDHCMAALMSDIQNWYDGEGGSGSITIDSDGTRKINVSYDNYELEEAMTDEAIDTIIAITTTPKIIKIDTGLEL